ncbi:hypothetical protein COLO4_07877 [Corchorus olitorius]|uniref:Uncharacterized protein n=1 Tax=Corchorus olitorius TaxID=93759 RepID=A0A1R3KI99_9ROSI|nr:hypothetical protein COLO4_07877 [Corchorus olitorius]
MALVPVGRPPLDRRNTRIKPRVGRATTLEEGVGWG